MGDLLTYTYFDFIVIVVFSVTVLIGSYVIMRYLSNLILSVVHPFFSNHQKRVISHINNWIDYSRLSIHEYDFNVVSISNLYNMYEAKICIFLASEKVEEIRNRRVRQKYKNEISSLKADLDRMIELTNKVLVKK